MHLDNWALKIVQISLANHHIKRLLFLLEQIFTHFVC